MALHLQKLNSGLRKTWRVKENTELPQLSGHLEALEGEVRLMPRTRPPYPLEFKRQIVELVRAGRGMRELAKEFEPCYKTIRTS